MLIDLHAHQMTRAMFDQDSHWGAHWEDGTLRVGDWVLGTKRPQAPTIDELMENRWAVGPRLAAMDDAEIDKFVVSMPLHLVMYHTPTEFNVRYATTVNDSLAEYCSAAPDRFYFWAHAPLQDPAAAARELERAVTQLGAKGLMMGGANFGGLEVSDEAFRPLWEKVSDLGVMIFVHGFNQSVTWDDPGRKDVFDTTSVVGMNADETLFFWHMVNGGVLDEFPDLKILITHGGGFVPFQLQRFDATNKTMAPDSRNKRPLADYIDNFYFDLDIHSPIMRRAIIDEVGIEHVLYGDNFSGADGHTGDLTDGLGLSEDEREQIRCGTTLKLMSF